MEISASSQRIQPDEEPNPSIYTGWPLLPLCSQSENVPTPIHDEGLGLCYEVTIPCGRTGEEAARWFRELQKEQSQGLWSHNYFARLQKTFPSYFLPPSDPLPSSSFLNKLGDFFSSKKESDHPLEKLGKMRVRSELTGDPALGEILFIRQTHFPPYDGERLKDFLKSELAEKITHYQFGISEVLVRLKAKHVFVEGLSEDIDSKTFSHMQLLTTLPAAAIPSVLTSLLQGNVILHRTSSPEEADFVKKYTEGASRDTPLYQDIVMKKREAWATREIIEFLEKNPGEKIVLIYGAAHHFCDDFLRMGYRPQIFSMWFEKSGDHLTEFLTKNIPEACP